jgi:hypothetical protein
MWLRVGLTALLSLVMVAGCGPHLFRYDQRGGPHITELIREAKPSFVTDIWYRQGDFMDPATIAVFVRDGTASAEIGTFVCAVVEPAVASRDPPEGLSVDFYNSVGYLAGADAFDCSTTTPPIPSPDHVRIWVRNETAYRVYVLGVELLVQVDSAPGSLGIAYVGVGPVTSTFTVVGTSCVVIGEVPVAADQGDVIVRVVGETVEVGRAPLFELPSDN